MILRSKKVSGYIYIFHKFYKKLGGSILRILKSVLFLFFVFTLWFSSNVFASPLVYEGVPAMLSPNHIVGVFIWRDDEENFHLSVSTAGEGHVFTGNVQTNGYFARIKGNNFKKNDNANQYTLKDRDKIEFQFTTEGKEFGMKFKISDATSVKFDLYMDGNKIIPANIYVGENGWHPNESQFTIDTTPLSFHEGDPANVNTVVVIDTDPWWHYGEDPWGHPWHHPRP
jgi:hypothetical protein